MVRALVLAALSAVLGAWPAEAVAAERGWRWPVQGELSTAYRYSGDAYAAGQHRGIDVAAENGAPVVAAAAGTVRFAGVVGSSGLTVSIRTAGGRFDTSYLHLSRIGVRAGQVVSAGAAIGAVGTSGRRSAAAAHLHFGVRVAGTRSAYRDPLTLLPPRGPVRERPRGVPPPVAVPVGVAPEPRPVIPRRAPVSRRVPSPVRAPRLEPAPQPWPARSRVPEPPFEPARRAAPAGSQPALGWAIACAGLLIAAAGLGGSRPLGRRSGRTSRSSIGARALLRHHADLLRQR